MAVQLGRGAAAPVGVCYGLVDGQCAEIPFGYAALAVCGGFNGMIATKARIMHDVHECWTSVSPSEEASRRECQRMTRCRRGPRAKGHNS